MMADHETDGSSFLVTWLRPWLGISASFPRYAHVCSSGGRGGLYRRFPAAPPRSVRKGPRGPVVPFSCARLVWSGGSLDAEGHSFKFSLGKDEPGLTPTLHARSGATPAILRLIGATGWHVLDTASGGWINLADTPDEGRNKIEGYKATVLPPVPPARTPVAPLPRDCRRASWMD